MDFSTKINHNADQHRNQSIGIGIEGTRSGGIVMSKIIITTQNAAQLVTSLLNLDVSALHTGDIAQCREPIWELRHRQNQSSSPASKRIDQRWQSPECLLYCIERLFNCLSEEAQKHLDKHVSRLVE
jgi:hypothetical protein